MSAKIAYVLRFSLRRSCFSVLRGVVVFQVGAHKGQLEKLLRQAAHNVVDIVAYHKSIGVVAHGVGVEAHCEVGAHFGVVHGAVGGHIHQKDVVKLVAHLCHLPRHLLRHDVARLAAALRRYQKYARAGLNCFQLADDTPQIAEKGVGVGVGKADADVVGAAHRVIEHKHIVVAQRDYIRLIRLPEIVGVRPAFYKFLCRHAAAGIVVVPSARYALQHRRPRILVHVVILHLSVLIVRF